MAIEYTPESSLVADPAEGGSFSTSNNAELAGAQSFAAKAKLSETAAATSETNSANSATASANSATASSTSATQSADSATASATSATQSATSATASATSATASANSATAAATSETNAGTSATTATTKASEASTSATNAATSETNAGTSATAASNSATAASTSATSASGSATTATTKASEASTSETNAGTSATASATSATASANSATAAATSATNAGTSETAAATSATNAATSATASANSATASAGSATSSSNSATSAATAQTAAEAARDAALASFDSFDDRYLGQKTSDPSTDNDGNALVAGTLYFNTSTDAMMVYEGSSWVAAYASLSGALIANNNLSDLNNAATARTNLGLGTIATADSTDYVLTTGGTFTGNVESPEFIGTLQGEVVFKAKAGEAITKGDAVYVSGISGNTPVVSKADADDAAKMPAFGLSADTVSANTAMEVVILGQLTNMDTSGYTLGDTLYISNTPGVLSATKPAGESSQLQNIGKVERVHASTGSILVSGSGRSAATPNLNDGQFFLGNGSNQAASTDFTTSVLGEISAGTGIGISGGGVISNSAPDQTVALTGAGATTVSGTYPNFTITSTNTTYSVGDGGLTEINFTSADNTKLDGIEADATADQTAAEILTAIKTVDGSGSGLDADTIDGLEPSALSVSESDRVTGSSFATTGSPSSVLEYQQADSQSDTKLAPNTDWHNTIRMGHGNPYSYFSNTLAMRMTGSGAGSIFTQLISNNTAQGWRQVWDSGNDGAGSGLDADTVDGFNTSAVQSNNTIAVRSGSGYLYAQYFNGTGTFSTTGATSGMARFTGTNGSDTFGRSYSAAAAGLLIGQSGGMSDIRTDLVVNGSHRDHGMFGTYDSNKTAQIWSMGTSFRNHSSGTNFGNLYGLAYKHTNNSTGGTMAGGHQMVWCQNGTGYAAMGSNIWTSGNVTAYSDIRVKENLKVIPNALDKVMQLNGYTYDRTDLSPATPEEEDITYAHNPTGRHVGVIAQEVLKVLPEAVTGGPNSMDGTDDDHYSVAYGNMVALLIEAVKELKAEVEELKGNA